MPLSGAQLLVLSVCLYVCVSVFLSVYRAVGLCLSEFRRVMQRVPSRHTSNVPSNFSQVVCTRNVVCAIFYK